MAENTDISWADHTYNDWEGCQKVGPGCDNCYAENRNNRFYAGANWGPGAPRRRTSEATRRKPLKWNADAKVAGTPATVFSMSLGDWADNAVPPEWREAKWQMIRDTPHLIWLLLTKRIGNVPGYLPADWGDGYPNVCLMVTVVNQEEADRDIRKLLRVPARWRGISYEPALGPLSLRNLNPPETPYGVAHGWSAIWKDNHIGRPWLDWVIAGGESQVGARPSHPDWFRKVRDDCVANDIPFHLKQWGEWVSVSEVEGDGPHHTFPDGATVRRVGVKKSGRLLDGVQWHQFPDWTA